MLGFAWSPAHAQFAVSEGGSPTYAHPITVPPGVAGMAPKLSLFYAGGGVSGPVGYGWSVQGLSSIIRCPATVATDGARKGVSYSQTDKLCLDGQRLIQTDANGVAASFPQSNDAVGLAANATTEFRTEKDTYARIRAYGYASGDTTGASGPQYFKVWTKSGQVYEYGAPPSADTNSKALITVQGKNVAMAWAVSRISDTLGNVIDFKYEQRDVAWGSGPTAGSPAPGHEWNIAEIQYSGNKVIFTYADRVASTPEDAAEAYHLGSKNVSVRLLQAVTTYVNAGNTASLGPGSGVATRTLKLTYDKGAVTKRSRVVKIQDCAGGPTSTRCLPGPGFTYADGGNDAYQSASAFNLATVALQTTAGDIGLLPGDFNGDGRTDFIKWSNTAANNRLYLSNSDGSFTEVPVGTGAGQFNLTDLNLFQRPSAGARADGCFMSLVADFNGDGVPDILRWAAATTSGLGTTCPVGQQSLLLFSNGDGSFSRSVAADYSSGAALVLARTVPSASSCSWLTHVLCVSGGNDFFVGDFNGDGFADIAEVRFDFGASAIDGAIATIACNPSIGASCHTMVRWGRADGKFDASSYFAPFYSNPSQANVFVMDVDGDGTSDLVVRGVNGMGTGTALISRRNGDFDRTAGALPACPSPGHFDLADLNGDGRADLVCAQPAVANNTIYVSNGTVGFVANAPTTTSGRTSLNAAGQDLVSSAAVPGASFTTADVNGDGRSDVIRVADAPGSNILYLSNGEGTFSPSATFTFNSGTTQLAKSDGTTDFITGDFTGRGNVEILRMVNGAPGGTTPATQNVLYVKVNPALPDQLVTVTAPGGAQTALYYATLANPTPANGVSGNHGPRYAKDATATAGLVNMTAPQPMVVTSVADSGVGNTKLTAEYSYAGLNADTAGRGVQGFREVRRQVPAPNGQSLTTITQYLQTYPYSGVAQRTDTYVGTLSTGPGTAPISSTVNVYCEVSAPETAASQATATTPCVTTAKPQRPYLRRVTEDGTDLSGTTLPHVVTENKYSTAGDVTEIKQTTTGTAAGLNQTFTRTTTNQYQAEDISCSDPRTCNWVRGRLTRASVASTVPNSLASVSTGAGTASNATATQGQGAISSVPVPPELVWSILQNALGD